MLTCRWSEAERVIEGMDWTRAGLYIQASIDTLRSHLAFYRGQFEDAEALVAEAADNVLQIGDLQAVLPTLLAMAQAQAALRKTDSFVRTLRRAIETRGSTVELSLSSWFLFEAVDTLAGLATADADAQAIRTGAELLDRLGVQVREDLLSAAGRTAADVGRALFGAAVEQLGALARRTGMEVPRVSGDRFPGRVEAISVLEREHRCFDAARVRLWLAEDGHPDMAEPARSTFAGLGAHAFLTRATAIRG